MERLNISAHHIDAREIRARLDTPAVRMLADRGVPFDLIKETLEHRLRTTGKRRLRTTEKRPETVGYLVVTIVAVIVGPVDC